jgi:hypothetical protein
VSGIIETKGRSAESVEADFFTHRGRLMTFSMVSETCCFPARALASAGTPPARSRRRVAARLVGGEHFGRYFPPPLWVLKKLRRVSHKRT